MSFWLSKPREAITMSETKVNGGLKLIESRSVPGTVEIPASTDPWSSTKRDFRLTADSTILFQYYFKRIKEPSSLHVKVTKDIKRCARAKINLALGGKNCGSVEMDNWTDEPCVFSNMEIVPRSGTNTIDYHITMSWYGFIEEENPSDYIQARSLYLNEEFSDAVLVIGKEKLPVHKMVLALQSPVFRTTFTTPMKESQDNSVTVEDIELSVMKKFLKYLYTEELVECNDLAILSQLFQAAHKYQVEKLLIICEKKLANSISADDVLEICEFADRHDSELIYHKSLDFIITRRKMLYPSATWMQDFKHFCATNPEISFAIMEAMFEKL